MKRKDAGPAVDAPAYQGAYCIDRFSIFQGTLRLSGWIYSPALQIARLVLQVPDGGTYAFAFGDKSPDLIPVFGSQASYSRFDHSLVFPDSRAAMIAARLLIIFKDGTSAAISHLGSPKDSLMSVFSQQVRDKENSEPGQPQRLLEIGSRARSGIVRKGLLPEGWCYSGFDVLDGPNVDVVGDAHQLSRSYPRDYFDGVMAFSVLEHLLMPWKAMIEINRVMKRGAIGIFTTHQCWPLHDQPWDFWRFSEDSWKALLNEPLGFEILETRMDEPAYIVAARCHAVTAFAEQPESFLASSVIFRKTGNTLLEWPVELEDIISTRYPAMTTNLR
jgi:hypothetical protein